MAHSVILGKLYKLRKFDNLISQNSEKREKI